MRSLITVGSALFSAGAIKFALHMKRRPSLEDYLVFRCGPADPALALGPESHFEMLAAHCWGCYSMVVGMGFVTYAALRWASRKNAAAAVIFVTRGAPAIDAGSLIAEDQGEEPSRWPTSRRWTRFHLINSTPTRI